MEWSDPLFGTWVMEVEQSRLRSVCVLRLLEEDEDLHSWRCWRSSADAGIPF